MARNLHKVGAPLSRGGRAEAPRVARHLRRRGASGAWTCITTGSNCLQVPSHREGRLARWASWGSDLPGRVRHKTASVDQR
eukprot:9651301-Alexandrium_andersonii.AAC.1